MAIIFRQHSWRGLSRFRIAVLLGRPIDVDATIGPPPNIRLAAAAALFSLATLERLLHLGTRAAVLAVAGAVAVLQVRLRDRARGQIGPRVDARIENILHR